MERVLVTSSNAASFYLPDSPRRSAIPTPIDTTTTTAACSKRLTLSKLLKLSPSPLQQGLWMWQQFSFAQKATIFHFFAQRLRRARTRSREGNLWGKSLFLCKSSSRKTLKYFLIVSLSAFRSAERDFFIGKTLESRLFFLSFLYVITAHNAERRAADFSFFLLCKRKIKFQQISQFVNDSRAEASGCVWVGRSWLPTFTTVDFELQPVGLFYYFFFSCLLETLRTTFGEPSQALTFPPTSQRMDKIFLLFFLIQIFFRSRASRTVHIGYESNTTPNRRNFIYIATEANFFLVLKLDLIRAFFLLLFDEIFTKNLCSLCEDVELLWVHSARWHRSWSFFVVCPDRDVWLIERHLAATQRSSNSMRTPTTN